MHLTRIRSTQFTLLAAFLLFGAVTSSASAQSRVAPPSTAPTAPTAPTARTTARGPVELVCLDHLDAGATRQIVQMLVERDAEITADHQTNCLIVLGASNLAPVRQVLADLEHQAVRRVGAVARAPARREARTQTRPRSTE